MILFLFLFYCNTNNITNKNIDLFSINQAYLILKK